MGSSSVLTNKDSKLVLVIIRLGSYGLENTLEMTPMGGGPKILFAFGNFWSLFWSALQPQFPDLEISAFDMSKCSLFVGYQDFEICGCQGKN